MNIDYPAGPRLVSLYGFHRALISVFREQYESLLGHAYEYINNYIDNQITIYLSLYLYTYIHTHAFGIEGLRLRAL